jgi:hypothetical protein
VRIEDHHVRGLGALLPLPRLVLDARALGERLEALTGDAAVVHEDILRALLRGDEAVPLAVVEPLHGSDCHKKHLLPNVTNGQGGVETRTGLALG